MENKISIEYCKPCSYQEKATKLAQEIQDQFGEHIKEVSISPNKSIGSFEIKINQDLVFSKKETGRFPHPGEIIQLIMMRIYSDHE
jgi:selenoprotein W-related protein